MADIGALVPTLTYKDPQTGYMTWASISSSLTANSNEPLAMTFTFPAEFKSCRFRRLSILGIDAATVHAINVGGERGFLDLIRGGKQIVRLLPSHPMGNCPEDASSSNERQSVVTWDHDTPIIPTIYPGDILDINVPPFDDNGAPAVDILFAVEVDRLQP